MKYDEGFCQHGMNFGLVRHGWHYWRKLQQQSFPELLGLRIGKRKA